jgi:hypothetical protein
VDWIIQNHGRKTHNKDFTAILAVSSVDALITYYEAFKAKKQVTPTIFGLRRSLPMATTKMTRMPTV